MKGGRFAVVGAFREEVGGDEVCVVDTRLLEGIEGGTEET